MANFNQQLEKSKNLNPDKVSKALFQFIRSIEKQILDKNREQMYEDRQDIHGKAMGFYSGSYTKKNGEFVKKGEPFSGKDSEDLFNKMYLQEVAGVVRFGSKSSHYADILKSKSWLSKDILGLTDENLNELIETELKPFIINHYRNTLEI